MRRHWKPADEEKQERIGAFLKLARHSAPQERDQEKTGEKTYFAILDNLLNNRVAPVHEGDLLSLSTGLNPIQ